MRLIGHKGDRAVNIEGEIGRVAGCSFLRLHAGDVTVSIEREIATERGN